MLAWFPVIIGLAVAGAPEPPKVLPAMPGECIEAIPVTAGEAISAIDAGTRAATCSGVLVPSSQIAHLLAVETWAWELKAYDEAELARTRAALALSQEQAERAKRGRRVMTVITAVVAASAGTMAAIAF